MKDCERPGMTQERDFNQTPLEWSEEEVQRSLNFLKKLKENVDKTIFIQYIKAMKSYESGCLTHVGLKDRVTNILCDHHVLLQEFHQLLSNPKKQNPKPESNRTVELLNKVEALGPGLYGEFLGAFGLPGDIEVLIEHVNVILRNHEALKEEFKKFLIDSLLYKQKLVLEVEARPSPEDELGKQKSSVECIQVSPSYWVRPGVDEGSSSDEVLNSKYISVGQFDP